jgi:phosphoglycolate phosphatase-like HAD superfamily hydrolase
MPIRCVLLDVDGTLVDSNPAHARAWQTALAEAGHDVPVERLVKMIGMGGDKILPELTGIAEDSDEGQRIARRRSEVFLERELATVDATRGGPQLAAALRARGLEVGLATSAKPDELKGLLGVIGGEELAGEGASSGDADVSKPDPDIVQAALEKLSCSPEETMLIGDTPYDIESAKRAGVATIAVRSGGWTDDELRGAVAVYADPAELIGCLDESPLGR